MLQAGLAAALAIQDEQSQAEALAALAPQLSGEAKEQALQAGLAAALTIKDEWSRAKALAALAIQDEWSRADALAALAPQLSGEMLQAGLAAALAIQHEGHRAKALRALAPQLRWAAQEDVLQAGLTAGLALQDKEYRADALAAFVAFAPGNAVFLQQSWQALADALLFRLQDQPRSAVLDFCARHALFAPPIFPTEVLEAISKSIIEICGEWEWL